MDDATVATGNSKQTTSHQQQEQKQEQEHQPQDASPTVTQQEINITRDNTNENQDATLSSSSSLSSKKPVILLPGLNPEHIAIAPRPPSGYHSLFARDADNPTQCITLAHDVNQHPQALDAVLYWLMYRDVDGHRDAAQVTCRTINDECTRHEVTLSARSRDLLLHVELPYQYDSVLLPSSCVFTLYPHLHNTPHGGKSSCTLSDVSNSEEKEHEKSDDSVVTNDLEQRACNIPATVWTSDLADRNEQGQVVGYGQRLVGFESRRGLCPFMLVEGMRLVFETVVPVKEAAKVTVHLAEMSPNVCDHIVTACYHAAEYANVSQNAEGDGLWPSICTRWFFDSRTDTHTTGFFGVRRPARQRQHF